MKPRPPRSVPEGNARYYVVETGRGAHDFRVPFPLWGTRLLDLMRRHNLLGLTKVEEALDRLDDVATGWYIGGAAIGLSWWHRNLDLSTPPPGPTSSTAALLDYGAAVLDELYEAGYEYPADIGALYSTTLARAVTPLVPQTQVEERVAFSGGCEEQVNSQPSTSA